MPRVKRQMKHSDAPRSGINRRAVLSGAVLFPLPAVLHINRALAKVG
jgi:hypothetical protein